MFGSNSIFIGSDAWEFNYEFNGFLDDENGVRTKKLGPKRESEKWDGQVT